MTSSSARLRLLLCGLLCCACAQTSPTANTAPPEITLTANSSSVTAPGPLTLSASTSGPASVSRVIFYDRGHKLSEDTAAPYEYTVNATAQLNGPHAYSAQAISAGGAAITPPLPVSVSIANTSVTELISNGDFARGQDSWWTAGAAGWTTSNQQSCLNVTVPGANPWDVLLGQGGIGLNQGGSYTLQFTARADKPTGTRVVLQFDGAPYTSYFNTEISDIGPTPKTYQFTFAMKEASDAKAAFQYQLGAKAAGNICISNISLKGPAFGSASASAADDRALVRLNQTGYLPNRPKLASLPFESASPLPWTLYDAAHSKVLSGTTKLFGADAASGGFIHQVDFSALTTAGAGYTLEVAGFVSHPFAVDSGIYSTLKTDALAYFYHNRSGIRVLAQYAGGAIWSRPAGHLGVLPNQGDTSVTCFKGTDNQGNVWPGCAYSLNASKGWYDAGDHGKYVVNSGVSVWTLMNMYERDSRTGNQASDADGTLSIPENKNGTPDVLDEVRWNLEFMLGMQVPDNQTLALPHGDQSGHFSALKLTPTQASGMVHHSLHDVNWTGLPLRPDLDPQLRALYYPSTAATLNLAAVAAQCARIYKLVDAVFSQRCLSAATRAWAAARANPDVYFYDLFPGGGPYNDTRLDDEFYWAAAELYTTTADPQYLSFLKASPLYLQAPADRELAWMELADAGTITLATVPNSLPAADIQTARQNIIATANQYQAEVSTQGYQLPFKGATPDWGSNSGVLNRSVIMGTAYEFTSNPPYLNAVLEGVNYLLGRNPMDKSYVSGYGVRPLMNPHHRFWAHSLDAALPGPPKGVLSGGPNAVSFSDPVAAKLKGNCVGLGCYTDDIGAYTMNEVTINWNAPLAWVAGFINQAGR